MPILTIPTNLTSLRTSSFECVAVTNPSRPFPMQTVHTFSLIFPATTISWNLYYRRDGGLKLQNSSSQQVAALRRHHLSPDTSISGRVIDDMNRGVAYSSVELVPFKRAQDSKSGVLGRSRKKTAPSNSNTSHLEITYWSLTGRVALIQTSHTAQPTFQPQQM